MSTLSVMVEYNPAVSELPLVYIPANTAVRVTGLGEAVIMACHPQAIQETLDTLPENFLASSVEVGPVPLVNDVPQFNKVGITPLSPIQVLMMYEHEARLKERIPEALYFPKL